MTEVEYVLNRFDYHFAAFREKKILLHGSRNYAEAILERYGIQYHFVGVMSLDPLEGSSWHGLPIFSEEDLHSGKIDLVILTERVRHTEDAFQSIRRPCRRNNIKIFNMYGLDEFRIHYEAGVSRSLSKGEALRRCLQYDLIAFEVMDVIFPFSIGRAELIPNKLFPWLIQELRSRGKLIRFGLSKSISEEKQIRALKDFGFLQEETQELIRHTGEDLSFRSLKENAHGKKILYFSCGLNEFILPRCYGIDSILYIERNVYDNIDCLRPNRIPPEKSLFSPGQREYLQKEILRHQLISFDIFDTLLLRKTLYPRDVYELTEQKALKAGYKVEGFAIARAEVEDSSPYCTLDLIYEKLADMYGWDRETKDALRDLELDVERTVLEPRQAIIEFFQFALHQDKRVVLTSDMYIPEYVLREILDDKGIRGYERIFVSCDCKQAKQSGLYKQLLTLCSKPDQILHVGDNCDSDGRAPNEFGIDSFIVPSAVAIAQERCWTKPIECAFSLMERCLLGLTISRLFADPFQTPNTWELPITERMAHMGNSIIGPLMVGHMCWLIRMLRAEHYDGVIFLARDGWLPNRLYMRICNRLGLPRGMYYYANRHSAFLCCSDSEEHTDRISEIGKTFGLDVEQLLKKVFMLPEDQLLSHEEGELDTEYIEKHIQVISEIAGRARKGYLRYSEGLGMRIGERFAVVDFIAAGNTQKFLSAALPFCFRGFYYGTYSTQRDDTELIEYYLQGKNPALLHGYVDLECFFSSPEPAISYMSEQGVPLFCDELRSKQELREIRMAWRTAEIFAHEFFDFFYQEGEEIASTLIEEMYDADTYLGIDMPVFDDWLQTEIKKRPNK